MAVLGGTTGGAAGVTAGTTVVDGTDGVVSVVGGGDAGSTTMESTTPAGISGAVISSGGWIRAR